MARNDFKIEGIEELQDLIKELGKLPQSAVTPASRKGMNVAMKAAKVLAPDDTGELKQGMKLIGEKSRVKGKKVYQVVFDRAKNDIFQKPVLNPSPGRRKIAYYPASQEYGYYARNGRYIPGFHFMEKALVGNANIIEKTIINEMMKRIEKAMKI